MKKTCWLVSALIGIGAVQLNLGCRPQVKPTKMDTKVLALTEVPDGDYRVNLQLRGRERRLTFELRGNVARCVDSDDSKLVGLNGAFATIGNGVFLVSLKNDSYRATQNWLFREDGSAVVKEIPDRGEKQTAIRIGR